MALGEVVVSLPWWCHPPVLLAPGYWRLFLNLVLLFQNWKSKIHKVSSLLPKWWPFFCFLCSVEVDTFNKCLETSRILNFQFWNNNTKFNDCGWTWNEVKKSIFFSTSNYEFWTGIVTVRTSLVQYSITYTYLVWIFRCFYFFSLVRLMPSKQVCSLEA